MCNLLSGCLWVPYSFTKESTKQEEEQDWSWVPKDFQADLRGGKIAYRYLDPSETRCRFNMPCIQVEVVAKDGCETLYAHTSLVDQNGVNVGYANDLTKSVGGRRKAILTFANDTNSAVNIEGTVFKCY